MTKWEDRTRGGYEYRIYAGDGAGTYRIHGAVRRSRGWTQMAWDSEGNANGFSDNDLVPKWEPKRGEPVWAWDGGQWVPRIAYGSTPSSVYSCDNELEFFEKIAPWNDGNPPTK